MNFFGHAAVARWYRESPAFTLGAMLPDFASMARARLAGVDHGEVAEGVALHHRTDDAFHGLPTFRALMGEAQDVLEERGVSAGPAMAVSHVGVELFLDGWLARRDRDAGEQGLALYRAALSFEDPGVRWRSEGGPGRLGTLRQRLLESRIPAAYAEPRFVAERLVWILEKRPRLALDEAGAAAVMAWAPEGARAVEGRAQALMDELRARESAIAIGGDPEGRRVSAASETRGARCVRAR